MQDLPVLRCKGNTFSLKPQDTLCFYTYFNVKAVNGINAAGFLVALCLWAVLVGAVLLAWLSWARLVRVLWVGQ